MYKKPICSSFDELTILKEKITDKAGKEFDSLISSLSINKEKNKEWADKFYTLTKETKKLSRSIRALKVWKWILLIPWIFPYFLMNKAQKKKQPIYDQKMKELNEAEKNLRKQLSEFAEQLSYEFSYKRVIEPVWQDVKLDLNMDNTAAANWEWDYGQYMPADSCATSLVSGQIFEHPFVVMNRKDQRWHPHVYSGSLPVTYTEYVDGKMVTRTEIVVATVTLPEPDWSYHPVMYYRCSRPLDLEFCNDMSARQLKKQSKKGNYQRMDNPQFDKIFPASRNNEVEYRVVFTPGAQEGFVKLFDQQKFSLYKLKEITSVTTPMHLIDNDFSDDVDYDLSIWKEKYVNWITTLVDDLATLSLPIANMPVYYQMSYKAHSKPYISRLQASDNAYWICNTYGLYDMFETDVIFEPTNGHVMGSGKSSIICTKISCNYFHPRHRVEMVPRPSHNGMVLVPVHVVDYLPRQKPFYIYLANKVKLDKEVIGDGFAFHSGQILRWGWSPIKENALKDLQKLISKK